MFNERHCKTVMSHKMRSFCVTGWFCFELSKALQYISAWQNLTTQKKEITERFDHSESAQSRDPKKNFRYFLFCRRWKQMTQGCDNDPFFLYEWPEWSFLSLLGFSSSHLYSLPQIKRRAHRPSRSLRLWIYDAIKNLDSASYNCLLDYWCLWRNWRHSMALGCSLLVIASFWHNASANWILYCQFWSQLHSQHPGWSQVGNFVEGVLILNSTRFCNWIPLFGQKSKLISAQLWQNTAGKNKGLSPPEEIAIWLEFISLRTCFRQQIRTTTKLEAAGSIMMTQNLNRMKKNTTRKT